MTKAMFIYPTASTRGKVKEIYIYPTASTRGRVTKAYYYDAAGQRRQFFERGSSAAAANFYIQPTGDIYDSTEGSSYGWGVGYYATSTQWTGATNPAYPPPGIGGGVCNALFTSAGNSGDVGLPGNLMIYTVSGSVPNTDDSFKTMSIPGRGNHLRSHAQYFTNATQTEWRWTYAGPYFLTSAESTFVNFDNGKCTIWRLTAGVSGSNTGFRYFSYGATVPELPPVRDGGVVLELSTSGSQMKLEIGGVGGAAVTKTNVFTELYTDLSSATARLLPSAATFTPTTGSGTTGGIWTWNTTSKFVSGTAYNQSLSLP
jgi:hypothetical protein